MNFVERKFKIPVRAYEESDLKRATQFDSPYVGDSKEPVPFRVAAERITHTDIKGWKEMRFRESEQTEEERGEFPCTLIKMVDDDILCSWPMKKFEEELRKFTEKYEEFQEQMTIKFLEQETALIAKEGK